MVCIAFPLSINAYWLDKYINVGGVKFIFIQIRVWSEHIQQALTNNYSNIFIETINHVYVFNETTKAYKQMNFVKGNGKCQQSPMYMHLMMRQWNLIDWYIL